MWGGFILSPARFSHYQDNTNQQQETFSQTKRIIEIKDTLWQTTILRFTPKVK